MENYKQKYEKALKVASQWHKDGIGDVKIVVECIFPELKESEDGGVSKKLHECVCMAINNDTLPYEERKYISEQVIPYLENLEKQKEQNHTWSEEDETALGDALWCCEQAVSIAKDENDMGNAWYAEKWLKSLKGRIQSQHRWKQENTDDLTDFENAMMHIGGSFFGENAGLDPNDTNAIKEQANILLELVPKQEWSEEDEKTRNWLVDELQRDGHPQRYYDAVKWLKSLKERTKGGVKP